MFYDLYYVFCKKKKKGSFSDFDQLIGDLNDPRLSALREKRDGAMEVQGFCLLVFILC
jgi:hypothetical protein